MLCCAAPASSADDNSSVSFRWDANAQLQRYEILNLPIYHPRFKTGFEESKDIVFRSDDLVAARFRVHSSASVAKSCTCSFSGELTALGSKPMKLQPPQPNQKENFSQGHLLLRQD